MRRRPRARSRRRRPGPVGIGDQEAADSLERRWRARRRAGGGRSPRGRPPRRPGRRPLRGSGQPAARAAACRSASVGRRLPDQHRRQLAAAAAALVLDLGLRLGIALDRVGGELVDVGEDRLGEQAQLLGVEPGAPRRPPRSAARPPAPRPGRRPAASRGSGPGAARRGRGRRRPRGPTPRPPSGSRIRATNWRSASSTPVRIPPPKLPSSGRAYSGTSRAIAARISAVDRVELGLDQRRRRRSESAAPGLVNRRFLSFD